MSESRPESRLAAWKEAAEKQTNEITF